MGTNRFTVLENDLALRMLGAGALVGIFFALSAVSVDFFRPLSSTFIPGQPTVFIDPLYPPGRWAAPKDGSQRLIWEPGYTDIYFPHRYEKIQITVNFENPNNLAFALGARTPNGSKLVSVPKTATIFTTTFLRSELHLVDERLGLIFSVPELRTRKEARFIISSVKVDYQL